MKAGLAAGTVLLMLAMSFATLANPVSAAPTPVWTYETPMGGPRTFAAIVQNDDGLVYLMGGVVNGTSWTSTPLANSYDPATGSWATLAPMPKGLRWGTGSLGPDGKVYVFSGYNDTDLDLYAPVQIYDPTSDSWSTGASIPTPVSFASAVTINDKIYVIGGRNSGYVAVSLVQVYDPAADSWSTDVALPSARYGGTAVEWRQLALYAGGYVGGSPSAEALIFYPGSGWSTLASMPSAASYLAGVVGEDGNFYVMGGGSESAPSNRAYLYDVNVDSWTRLPDLNLGVTYLGRAASTPDGKVLVLGGTNLSLTIRASDRVESLQIMTKSITVTPSTVDQGESVIVTIELNYAYETARSYSLTTYVSAGGANFSPSSTTIPVPGRFGVSVNIPQEVPAGADMVVLYRLTVSFTTGSWTYDPIELPITVVDTLPVAEQLASLQLELATLQAMLDIPNANLTALAMQAAILQAKLDGIIAGSAATTEALNATFANLQSQLDSFQTQIDRVEKKADNAGMYGIITLVLVIIVIVLVALILMMARKKP